MKKKSIWQVLSLTGLLGVIAYTAHVVLGGILWKEYNPITQSISELTGNGAPNAALLSIFTTIYGILVVIFSVCVYINFKTMRVKRTALIGAVLLIIMEVTSLVGYSLFPLNQQQGVSLMDFQNIMHLAVTGVVVICTIGSGYFIGIGLRRSGIKGIGLFIIICSIVITVFGAFTPISMGAGLPVSGLAERINIFSLQLWISVLSVYLFIKADKKEQA